MAMREGVKSAAGRKKVERSAGLRAKAEAPSKPTERRGARWSNFKGPEWQSAKIGDFYRPLKKVVTLRLDADVLAWFKKDGNRYQTRINQALRKVMEQELKKG